MSLSISSTNTSATAWLSKTLQTNGVSSAGAKTTASDLIDAAETSLAANPNESDDDFRSALDAKIDADVKSGALSKDDADKVKKALDQIDGQDGDTTDASAATDASGGAEGASPSGGGGGGGGGSTKTEVSETVTISGNTKTTVITYDDGTTETKTATATQADLQKYDKKAAAADKADGQPGDAALGGPATANDAKAAQDYLAQTPPGTLFDKAA